MSDKGMSAQTAGGHTRDVSPKGARARVGRRGLSLRWKMALSFGTLFVTAVTLSALTRTFGIPFTAESGSYGEERAQVMRNLSLVADLKKERLVLWLGERKGDLTVLADDETVKGAVANLKHVADFHSSRGTPVDTLRAEIVDTASFRTLKQRLDLITRAYPVYQRILLADADEGLILASTEINDVGTPLPRAPFFDAAKDYLPRVWPEIMPGSQDGKPYLVISKGLASPESESGGNREPVAVAIAYIDADAFVRPMLYTGDGLGESGDIVLVNQGLWILISPKYPLSDGTRLRAMECRVETEPARLGAAGGQGLIRARDYRGVPVLAAYRYIPVSGEDGWGMVVKRDEAEVFGPLKRRLVFYFLMGLLGVLAVIGLSVIIAKRVSRPVEELSLAARAVEAGNLDTMAPVHGADEIARLAFTFNSMVTRIRDWQKELEEEVQTRTAELAILNQNLTIQIAHRKRDQERQHELNEEIKRFAHIVSHDLRAPLVNLKGFAGELKAALAVLAPAVESALPGMSNQERAIVSAAIREDVPEALSFIEASVHRMDGLISAILQLSRLGRRQLEPEPVQTEMLVRETLNALAHQIGSKGVSVTVGSLPEVIADRVSLDQIFGNLIDNAVKYLDPCREGVIEITGEQTGDETVFHIRDNGVGIAPEDQPKVFDIFQRVCRHDVPGEGMGLAYVRALVRRHGGRIWVTSSPNAGSTFSFSLATAGQTHRKTEESNHQNTKAPSNQKPGSQTFVLLSS